eukprot:gene13514-13639_t
MFTGLAARSMRIQGMGGRSKGRGGTNSNKGRRKAVLVNATCGPKFDEDAPCPEYLDALLLSLMPQEYSSSNPEDTGGFNFISPAQSQLNCAACVGFAATAAAEAAIATNLQQQWQDSPRLSEANISFCGGIIPAVSCSSGSSFDSLIWGASSGQLQWWASRQNFPFTGTTNNINCAQRENALPSGGALRLVDDGNALDSLSRVKEAIVLQGGVITSMIIWSNFKSYPKPKSNAGGRAAEQQDIYSTTQAPSGDPTDAPELHAVYCFGWNDTSPWSSNQSRFTGGSLQGYFLCKNSWGTRWGLNGTFKIAYGAASILQPDYTYALRYRTDDRPQEALQLLRNGSVRVSDPDYPGCWLFSPPNPMRLLHVAAELSLAWQAVNRADIKGGVAANQLQILQDLILSNYYYSGKGSADNVTIADSSADTTNATTAADTFLLTGLVGRSGTPAVNGNPFMSFLLCNKSAGTSTVPSTFATDHDEEADCSLLATDSSRTERWGLPGPEVLLSCPAEEGRISRVIGWYGGTAARDNGSDTAVAAVGVICGSQVRPLPKPESNTPSAVVISCPGLPQAYETALLPAPGGVMDRGVSWDTACAGSLIGSACMGACVGGNASSTCTAYGWGPPTGSCTGEKQHDKVLTLK